MEPNFSILVAHTAKYGIGYQNKLPWGTMFLNKFFLRLKHIKKQSNTISFIRHAKTRVNNNSFLGRKQKKLLKENKMLLLWEETLINLFLNHGGH